MQSSPLTTRKDMREDGCPTDEKLTSGHWSFISWARHRIAAKEITIRDCEPAASYKSWTTRRLSDFSSVNGDWLDVYPPDKTVGAKIGSRANPRASRCHVSRYFQGIEKRWATLYFSFLLIQHPGLLESYLLFYLFYQNSFYYKRLLI